MHCYYILKQNLASKKIAPELNEVLSQSVKKYYSYKNSALNTKLLEALSNEMGCYHKNLLFHLEVLKRLYELRKELELFLIDYKSGMSHYFQDRKWATRLTYLSDIFAYINKFNLKLQDPNTIKLNA
jgi:hypothetical protein